MKPLCPECSSSWVAYAVPVFAIVVQADDAVDTITLAHRGSGRFLDILDIDRSAASCLDCGASFDARPDAAKGLAAAMQEVAS